MSEIRQAAFNAEAKLAGKSDRVDGGYNLRFQTQPEHINIRDAKVGRRYQLAFVEIGDDEQPVFGGTPNVAEEPDGRKVGLDQVGADREISTHHITHNMTTQVPALDSVVGKPPARALPQRVGRICSDIRFIRWLSEYRKIEMNAESVANFVRLYCGVTSRGEIMPGTEAETKWNLLESAYLAENR